MGATRGGEISVLHVDDESGFADMTAEFLERVDDRFSVETATSASEGLDRLASADFECIVSDYQMPERNGIEFLEAVREEYGDVPFVLFTGKGSEEVASDAFSAGATDYVQKDTATDQYELLANRIQNAVEQRRTQRQVAETERRLRTIAEHSNDVLWEFSADWTELLFINSPYEDIWGGSVAELRERPQSFLEGVHPDDRSKVADGMERLSAGESVDLECRVNADEDFGRWVWIQGEPVFDDDGAVDKVVGFVRDVTDRKEGERERERTNTILRTMVEHLPMGVLVEDTDREVLMANDRFGETVGVSITGEEFIGRDCEQAAEEMKDLFADPEGFIDGIDERIDDRRPVRNEELALADGRVLERDYVPYSLPDGEANLWLYRDVTDRTRKTEELNTRAKAMDASIDGMALLDADGEYVYVNEAHADVYGFDDPEAFLGETWRMCYDEDERARFETEIIPTLYEDGNWRGVATGRRRDGSTFPQELSLTTTDEGGIICVVRDISERKKREHGLEQLQR